MKYKKLLAFFLAFCTCFSSVPTAAIAEAVGANEPIIVYDEAGDVDAQEDEALTEEPAAEVADPVDEQQLVADTVSSEQPKGKQAPARLTLSGDFPGDGGGQGTDASPYIIKSVDDLIKLAENVNSGISYSGTYFQIDDTASIDLTSREWTPIGTESHHFSGVFDGNGQTISSLKISGEQSSYGLFGTTSGATIKNLTISNVEINLSSTGNSNKDYVGALVGRADGGAISNINVTGDINISGNQYVGGAVGYASGTTMSGVSVSTTSGTNGIIGSDVGAQGAYGNAIGGVVGCLAANASLTNCASSGLMLQGVRQVGGLVGLASGSGAIDTCSVSDTSVICSTTEAASTAKPNELTFGGMVGAFDGSCGNVGGTLTSVTVKSSGTANVSSVRKGIVSAGKADSNSTNALPSVNVTTKTCTLEVGSASELASFRDEVNRGVKYDGTTVKLTAGIDLSSYTDWEPIGSGSGMSVTDETGEPSDVNYTYFGGTFDGNGKTITGLTIANTHTFSGLFGAINYATIKDLTINGATINADKYVGAVVGHACNNSQLSNTDLTGTLSIAGKSFVGGVVGLAANTRIENVDVTATGTITAAATSGEGGNAAGGVAGYVVNTGSSRQLYFCKVNSSSLTVSAARQGGGLVGLLGAYTEVVSCSVSGVFISCTTTDDVVTSAGADIISFGGLAGAMKGTNVTVTDASVSNVTLSLADSSLSSNNKSSVRIGNVTGGTYGASSFAVTESTQTGSATASNVTKPTGTASVATAHALINGTEIALSDGGKSMTAKIPAGVFTTSSGEITIAGSDTLYVIFNGTAAQAIATAANDSALTLTVQWRSTDATTGVTTYEITMVADSSGASVYSSTNAAGTVTVYVPYTRQNEAAVVDVNLVTGETKTKVPSSYNNTAHTVHFAAPHFSTYEISESIDSSYVARIGETYYATLEEAFSAANSASSAVTIDILVSNPAVTKNIEASNAYGITVDTALSGGATLDYSGKKIEASNGAGGLTFTNNVTVTGDAYTLAASRLEINGAYAAGQIYVDKNAQVAIKPTATVQASERITLEGYYLSVEGSLAVGTAAGLTTSYSGTKQLAAQSIYFKDGCESRLNLQNTFVTAGSVTAETHTSSSDTEFRVGLGNSVLYVNGTSPEFNLHGKGWVNLEGGSQIIIGTGGSFTLNENETLKLDATSTITTPSWTNNGEVTVDVKDIDCSTGPHTIVTVTDDETIDPGNIVLTNNTVAKHYCVTVVGNAIVVSADSVASVTLGNYYACFASLADAIAAAPEGATVTLLADIRSTDTFYINKSLTLDLNDHIINKYNASDNYPAIEVTSGNLTIKNTGDASTASVFANSGPAIYFNGSALTITGGNFESGGHPHAIELGTSAASLSISGGYFACSGDFVHMLSSSAATITLTGGTFLYDDVYEYCESDYYPIINPRTSDQELYTYTVTEKAITTSFATETPEGNFASVKGIITHALNDISLTDDQRTRVEKAYFSLQTSQASYSTNHKTVTYEHVCPSVQLTDSADSPLGAIYEIENYELKQGETFSFKLSVSDLANVAEGKNVKITHEFSDGTTEVQIGKVDGDKNVTVTGITAFSTFTLEITEQEELATYGYSISLQDSIDIIFNVKNLIGDASDYGITYTFKNETTVVDSLTSKTLNSFTIAQCAAKEMTDEVVVIITYRNNEIDRFTLSIQKYCDQIFQMYGHTGNYKTEDEEDMALVQLCEATLDYGTQAQNEFDYNTDKPANHGSAYFNPSDITIPDADITLQSNCPGITETTFSLVTSSKTEFIIYLKHDASLNASDFKFVLDGVELDSVTEETSANKFKIVISGIVARLLDEKHTLQVSRTDTSLTGNYVFVASPVDYMSTAVKQDVQVALNKAFYNYYLMADAYFAKRPLS